MLDTLPRPVAPRTLPARGPLLSAIHGLASLRLTVVLFALSLVLVFAGTLAQMDANIWIVVKSYFRSWFVWVPVQLFVRLGQVFVGIPTSMNLPQSVGLPFPGGWTIGLLLLINLLAAHAVRFKLSWRRSGILLIHGGMILLLLGEMVTGLFQIEQKMTIAVGETVDFTDRSAPPNVELVLTKAMSDKENEEIVIPQSMLKVGERIQDPRLPCDIQVVSYAKNSRLRPGDRPGAVPATDGKSYSVDTVAGESGVDVDAGDDQPAIGLRFLNRGSNEELASGTFSTWYYRNLTRMLSSPGMPFPQFPPQVLKVGDTQYQIELRPVREYKPYAITLQEFNHDKYMGTERPKNFSSLIQLRNPADGVDREVLIYMNSPMRYHGEAFFQSGYFPDNKGTVLHVVRNPGWLMPYIACSLVTLGMLLHFGMHLNGYLKRRSPA